MKRSLTSLLCIGLSLAAASGASGQQASAQVKAAGGCPDSSFSTCARCSPSLKPGNLPGTGPAAVDGVENALPGEWSAGDLFANLYAAGCSSKPILARAYVKFVCDSTRTTATVFVLVTAEPGRTLDVDSACGATSWIKYCAGTALQKVVDSCDPATGPSTHPATNGHFKYVGVNGKHAAGYEASFTLRAGATYSVSFHAGVSDPNGAGQTAASAGFPDNGVCMTLACPAACTTPPTLIGCVSTTLDLGCNPKSLPTCDRSITASDCQGPVTVECTPGPVTDAGCRKTQRFTYSATGAGGMGTCAVIYTWTVDAQAPVITLAPASEVSPACNPTADQVAAAFGAASVSDDCGTNLLATGTLSTEKAGSGCSYSVTKTWTVRDSCGRTGTATQTVRFKRDTEAPKLTCPADITANGLDKCTVTVSLGTATASDNCGAAKITNDAPKNPNGSLAPFAVGTTTVTWTATDGCGNTSTCQQKVTVLGQIKVTTCFDVNGNGVQDLPVAATGEAGMPNVRISLSNGDSTTTGAGGNASFNVAPGTYTVSEVVPGGWVNTTGTSAAVEVTNCGAMLTFGNVFLCRPSNGLTLHFWTSASGEKVLNANPGWVALLNGLTCLRNDDGALHAFSTVADLETWLLAASATNMAYMLSAHLAVNVLNGSYNGLGGTVFVPGGIKTKTNVCIVPFASVPQPAVGTCGLPLLTLATFATPGTCGCASKDGQVTVGDLQLKAACLLAAYPNTIAASTQRTYQECVKDILDMIDNNGNPPGASAYPCGGVKIPVPAGTCPSPVTPSVKGGG